MAQFDVNRLVSKAEHLSPQFFRLSESFRKLKNATGLVIQNGWRWQQRMVQPLRKRLKPTPEQEEAKGRVLSEGMSIVSRLQAAVTVPLQAYAKQEQASVGLKVSMMAASGDVSENFNEVNNLALSLGKALPGTTESFQRMMQALIEKGMSAQEVLQGLGKETATFAVAMQKTPAAAAEFVASLRDVTHATPQQLPAVLDTAQRASQLGVGEADFLAFFHQLQPMLTATGQPPAQTVQALAPVAVMMHQSGLSGAAAGQATQRILQGTQDNARVSKANHRLRRTGIALDFTQSGGDLSATLQQLEKLKNLAENQRSSVLSQLFGDDTATLQAVNALIDRSSVGYGLIQQQMLQQADYTQRASMQVGTLNNSWETLTETVAGGLAAAGGAFAANASIGLQWMTQFAEHLTGFVAQNPELIRSVLGIVTAFTAVKVAITGVTVAMKLMNLVALMTPMGRALSIVTTLAGLVIGNLDELKKAWASFKNFFRIGDDKAPSVKEEFGVKQNAFSRDSSLRSPDAFDTTSMIAASQAPQKGELRVTFDGAPPGMRVEEGPQHPKSFSYDVGYTSLAPQY